ncbi:hypothetical protein EII22_09070 [Coriobacteriales bacterium OH1046]|nr:hypothetical protein EII22_09070 [Coriobacteriales bacterium OH1046]
MDDEVRIGSYSPFIPDDERGFEHVVTEDDMLGGIPEMVERAEDSYSSYLGMTFREHALEQARELAWHWFFGTSARDESRHLRLGCEEGDKLAGKVVGSFRGLLASMMAERYVEGIAAGDAEGGYEAAQRTGRLLALYIRSHVSEDLQDLIDESWREHSLLAERGRES